MAASCLSMTSELTMKIVSCFYCRKICVINIVKALVKNCFPFKDNSCSPFIVFFHKRNTFKARSVFIRSIGVTSVFCSTTDAQVANSIVSPYAINMVNIAIRKNTVNIKPSKPMGLIIGFFNAFEYKANDYISSLFAYCSNRLANKSRFSVFYPSKDTAIRIIANTGFKHFLSKHITTPFVALMSIAATSKVLAFGCPLAANKHFNMNFGEYFEC